MPAMTTPVLLVTTATTWLGTARIPRPLAQAGFEVSLLAPKNSLAENSRFVARTRHLPDDANPKQWLEAFAAIVAETSPRLVLPCDDMAFRLMQTLVLSPPDDLAPMLRLQLAALIKRSLGDPDGYRTSVEKTLLLPAAAALGVRVPPHAGVATVAAAEAFVAKHGYPVVLKRNLSTAGSGVAIVERAAELAPAFAELTRPETAGLPGSETRQLMIQASIPGQIHYDANVAWNGKRIGGFAVARLEFADVEEPAAVVRCHHSAEIRDFSSRLARGFGMSGMFAMEYVVHRDTGEAYLLEIARRVSPGHHVGLRVGVDLCAALYSALHGGESATPAEIAEGASWVNVHFPQEWLRDPRSPNLHRYPVDVPWDEPELFEAMLAMRRQR
jgi:predicted ATP-grasp superfamily ATP-dependent carboligase